MKESFSSLNKEFFLKILLNKRRSECRIKKGENSLFSPNYTKILKKPTLIKTMDILVIPTFSELTMILVYDLIDENSNLFDSFLET